MGSTSATHRASAGTADVRAAEASAMRRALGLAARGPARGINPRVGCVLLSPAGDVIAEGWHRGAGTPHAEVDALSRLAVGAAHGATAVVTLEPCNHTGRTGPCAEALIAAGVARVVYAVADPGLHSAGGGARLRAAGVDVERGLLADEAEALICDWLFTERHGRPFVTVKWASTLDGRIAAADGTSRWITGPESRADVHARRAAADAIAVGTGTVLADDPALTARDATGALLADQPVPVVFGRSEVPADAAVLHGPHPALRHAGEDLAGDLDALRRTGIRSLFVEGGPTLATAFLSHGLVDEVVVYLAPTLLGGPRLAVGDLGIGTIAEALRLETTHVARLGDDVLVVARPTSVRPRADADGPTGRT